VCVVVVVVIFNFLVIYPKNLFEKKKEKRIGDIKKKTFH